MPTRTINRLHFSDLDPGRFEDLCLKLLDREPDWKELSHPGRSGNDGGIDLRGTRTVNGVDQHWIVQCKRVQKLTPADAVKIVAEIRLDGQMPSGFVLIASCPVSRIATQRLNEALKERGVAACAVWSDSTLETILYNQHNDLLYTYFGVELKPKQRSAERILRESLRMEKRLSKDLIDHAFTKNPQNWRRIDLEPWSRFISSRAIIRSVHDKSYPDADTEETGLSSWFRHNFYDFYHNGLEFWIANEYLLLHDGGKWEHVDFSDPRIKDPNFHKSKAKFIGRIPFSAIVDYKLSDEYYSEPHIFCRFEHNGSPFERLYLKAVGSLERELRDWDLDEEDEFPRPGAWRGVL